MLFCFCLVVIIFSAVAGAVTKDEWKNSDFLKESSVPYMIKLQEYIEQHRHDQIYLRTAVDENVLREAEKS